jgi:predicted nucleic acid-binding protein
MIIVSDTSPIINLAVIGQLSLLQKLYGTVVVPQAVYEEIVIEGAGQAGATEVAQADWIEIKGITNRPLVTSLEGELDIGEAEAIVLAVELKADLLLIDERKGRIVANRLGVNSIGLLGVLIRAKHEGMISAVGLIMDELRSKAGFWIDDELYNYILQVAGECK